MSDFFRFLKNGKEYKPMIKAQQKPLDEILEFLQPYNKLLLVGCNACVAVCHAGGEKEVGSVFQRCF